MTLRERLAGLPAEAMVPAGWVLEQLGEEATAEPAPPSRNGAPPDELLTAAATAPRVGMSRRWVYLHADELPFTRRLPGGALRFSSKGIDRWLATRK